MAVYCAPPRDVLSLTLLLYCRVPDFTVGAGVGHVLILTLLLCVTGLQSGTVPSIKELKWTSYHGTVAE